MSERYYIPVYAAAVAGTEAIWQHAHHAIVTHVCEASPVRVSEKQAVSGNGTKLTTRHKQHTPQECAKVQFCMRVCVCEYQDLSTRTRYTKS